ncbi:MAG: serine/threonine-protein kinase [bacterium]
MSSPPDPSAAAARHAQVRALFLAAQDVPPGERSSWLAGACDDAEVAAEVASLLDHVVEEPLLEQEVAAEPGLDEADPLGLVGVTLDDRYAVERFVAAGGFGFVYRARQIRWDRPVAVKVFRPTFSAADEAWLHQAFVKEGALLTSLSRRTTGIVQSYDLSSWERPDGSRLLYTVLEWLDGRPLSAALGDGAWSLDRTLAVIRPVAQALAVVHEAGVAHRDVKPGNIFLVEEEGVVGVKLLDFGVAKVAAERAGGFKSTAGKVSAFTVGYAAPEQLSRSVGATGPWTDVYALALVAVEMLAGQRPYGDDSDVIRAMARARDPVRRPTPRSLGVDVPAAVEAVFAQALAVEPARRHPDAGAFLRALEAALAAPPPRRWLRWALPAALAAAGVAAWLLLRG